MKTRRFVFVDGAWAGLELAVDGRGGVALLEGDTVRPMPLRELARAYPVGHGPWPWLRAHGIRRPSTTSGKSGTPRTRAEGVFVRLSVEERAALDALAARWGCSLSEAVARAVREAR